MKDSLEGKLFGIGSESYVVGSHEFYLGYAVKNNVMLTVDMGHYHPTESVADKITAMLLFVPELLLHVSRGVRWDSDHVVILGRRREGRRSRGGAGRRLGPRPRGPRLLSTRASTAWRHG